MSSRWRTTRTRNEEMPQALVGVTDAQTPASASTATVVAYVMYATTEAYLCNSLVNAHRLVSLQVTNEADVVVLYPDSWETQAGDRVTAIFAKLKDLKVRLAMLSAICILHVIRHMHRWSNLIRQASSGN